MMEKVVFTILMLFFVIGAYELYFYISLASFSKSNIIILQIISISLGVLLIFIYLFRSKKSKEISCNVFEHNKLSKLLEDELEKNKCLNKDLRIIRKNLHNFVIYQKEKLNETDLLLNEGIIIQKHAERECYQTKEQLSIILESMPIAFYKRKADDDFACTYITYNVKNITGFEPQEFISDTKFWIDRVHPDDKLKLLENLLNIFKLKKCETEYRWRISDNSYRWFNDMIHLVNLNDGISYITGGFEDITKRKLLLDRIKDNEERFRFIAEHSQDIIYKYNLLSDRGFKYISPSVKLITGYTPLDFYEDPQFYYKITHNNDKYMFDTILQDTHVLKHSMVFRIIKKSGEIIWLEEKSTIIKDENNIPVSIEGVARDITERMLNEKKQNELLERLEKANNDLNDFVYVVSHDLKAPLNTMGLLIELFIKSYFEVIDDKGKKLINNINIGIDQLYNLINGILLFSKVGLDKNTIEKVDLNEVLEEIIKIINPSDKVNIQVIKKLPLMLTSKSCVIQLFQNLLVNAIKFNDKKKVKIKIDYEDDGLYWRFSITDNGIGINKTQFNEIFKLFKSIPFKENISGTGIGLAVVKRIVNSHGGEIWIDSEINIGTTFYFTLEKSELNLVNLLFVE
ncbi:MAG: PAS domain-containing protein [Spirochaetota bacterium]|nr:PAS domain-containing protein [Spirochaetota bacterium]